MKEDTEVHKLKENAKAAMDAFEAAKAHFESDKALFDAAKSEYEAVQSNYKVVKASFDAAKKDMEAKTSKATFETTKAELDAAIAEYDVIYVNLEAKRKIIEEAETSKKDKKIIEAAKAEFTTIELQEKAADTRYNDAYKEFYKAKENFEHAEAANVDFEAATASETAFNKIKEEFGVVEGNFKAASESYKEKTQELKCGTADKDKLKELALNAAEQAIAVFKAQQAQLSKQYKFNKKVPDKKVPKEDLKELASLASEAELAFKEYSAFYDPKEKLHLRLEHILHKAVSYYDLSYQVRDKQISSKIITKEHASVQQSFDEIDSLMHRFNSEVREGTDKVVKSEQARFYLFETIYNQAISLKDGGYEPDTTVKNNFHLFHSRNDSKKTGYAGVAYLSEDGTELIIGSPPMFLFNDIRSISALYHGFVPNQFDQSLKPFLDDIMKKLEDDGKKPKITLTGFSLGAVMSDLGAAYLHEHGYNVSSHGIDNPGTGKLSDKVRKAAHKELVKEAKRAKKKEGREVALVDPKSKPDIHNYVMSEQTIANSVNQQAGTVHIISNPKEESEVTQQYRPDRIFGIRHLMNFKTGFELHNMAEYRLNHSAPVLNTLKIEDKKQNTASSILRVSTTCLVVTLIAPFLIAASPFIAIGVGIEKLASAIKEYCNKDNSQGFHKGK